MTGQGKLVLVCLSLLYNCCGLANNLRSYCLATDKECDEDWAPFDNMASALVGYDLPKGNPFATNAIEDPGLRKQIFNVTWFDEETEDYVLETGINSREYNMCDKGFTGRGATNMKGYEKASSASSLAGLGFDLGIEAEDVSSSSGSRHEGLLPSVISVAWQKTDDYETVRQFIFRTRGAIVLTEAQCITHKVDVSHFLTPGFHPAFIEVLKYLEKQDTKVKQTRAFKRFVRDYGTHYISSTYMGAKIALKAFYTNYERLKYGRSRLFNCTAEFARKHFGLQEDPDKEDDDGDNDDDDDEEEDNEVKNTMPKMEEKRCPDIDPLDDQRIAVTTYGAGPGKSFSDWPDQEFAPIPIKFELTPIVNVFTSENLDQKLNISSAKILDWFLPLYLKYCSVFDFDCSPESGCGFDDACDFEENCVFDRTTKKGHRCQAPSWADVPNWPQMPVEADNKLKRRTLTVTREPESPKISWFFEKDTDQSGSLTLAELWEKYAENNWYNTRYQTAIEKLIYEADVNRDRGIDMNEYIKLHETHPWYAEQITFMLMNTDNNDHLSKQELLEASSISPDMHQLNFSQKQLENLVDGLMAVGDKNRDGKITFDEYVGMTRDVFVDNFAPTVFKRVMR